MFEVQKTAIFERWLAHLRDKKGKAIIARRMAAIELGHSATLGRLARV